MCRKPQIKYSREEGIFYVKFNKGKEDKIKLNYLISTLDLPFSRDVVIYFRDQYKINQELSKNGLLK